MKLDTLIIIFTVFDDKIQPYLDAFQIQANEDIHWLGISYGSNSLELEEEEMDETAFPLLLIKDDNYSCETYKDEIKAQLDLHQHFVLVLHQSSLDKFIQTKTLQGLAPSKLIHPIKEEHHDGGSAHELLRVLSNTQDEERFYEHLKAFIKGFQFDEVKEAKLYLLNSVNEAEDAQKILAGLLGQCLVKKEVQNLLKNEELNDLLNGFSLGAIDVYDMKNNLAEILKD